MGDIHQLKRSFNHLSTENYSGILYQKPKIRKSPNRFSFCELLVTLHSPLRIHLIKKQTIEEFAAANVRSRISLEDWLEKIRHADWKKPADIKATFGTADLLGKGSNRVVFDIGGNNYRVICSYLFGEKNVHLFVCWIGTHKAYDILNTNNEQYTVHIY